MKAATARTGPRYISTELPANLFVQGVWQEGAVGS
jgi:hypothetical protein